MIRQRVLLNDDLILRKLYTENFSFIHMLFDVKVIQATTLKEKMDIYNNTVDQNKVNIRVFHNKVLAFEEIINANVVFCMLLIGRIPINRLLIGINMIKDPSFGCDVCLNCR